MIPWNFRIFLMARLLPLCLHHKQKRAQAPNALPLHSHHGHPEALTRQNTHHRHVSHSWGINRQPLRRNRQIQARNAHQTRRARSQYRYQARETGQLVAATAHRSRSQDGSHRRPAAAAHSYLNIYRYPRKPRARPTGGTPLLCRRE